MALDGMRRMLRPRTVADLRDRQAAALLDRLDAERAVAAAARENDRDGVLVLVRREAAEQHVDRVALVVVRLRLADVELAPLDGHEPAGRPHIDVVLAQGLAILGIGHRELGGPSQDVGEHARMVGRHVGAHDERHRCRAWGHATKQPPQRLKAAGGGADPDDEQAILGRQPHPPHREAASCPNVGVYASTSEGVAGGMRRRRWPEMAEVALDNAAGAAMFTS